MRHRCCLFGAFLRQVQSEHILYVSRIRSLILCSHTPTPLFCRVDWDKLLSLQL